MTTAKALSISVCALAAALVALAAQGQQAPPPQNPPQFRATTDLVLIDVSVLDRNRRPVKGLAATDFTVLEDDVPQQIGAFTAIDLPDAEAPTAKWMGRSPFDVQTNRVADGRLVLLYLDDRVGADPFSAKSARDVGHALIDQLGPNDQAAVAYAIDHRNAQEFTTDRARLHEAVDKLAGSQPIPISVVGTLRDLCRLLGAIPERRKMIVYVGPGQGFSTEVLSTMEKMSTQSNVNDNLSQQGQRDQLNNLLALFRVAQQANVNLYTIDPSGLGANQGSPQKEFLRLVAANTGGRAVTGNNVPASEMPKIFVENASYYLIAFRSANPRNEGKFRRLQVKVNRPNVEVRARRGYVEGRGGPTMSAAANPALARLVPATDLSINLWTAPLGVDQSGANPVAIMIDLQLPREGAPPVEHIAVSYSVVDMSGREQTSGRQDLTVSPPAGTSPVFLAGMQAVARLPPGRYDVRVAARSIERRRQGGLLGDINVPDYSKEPLSMTGIFVGTVAGGTSRADEIATLTAIANTTDRTFVPAAPITAAVKIYQSKQPLQPVTLKATILDGRDKPAFEATQKFDAPVFTSGPADYRLALPLATLAPGQYLLRLEAQRSGAPVVKREVRFAVK